MGHSMGQCVGPAMGRYGSIYGSQHRAQRGDRAVPGGRWVHLWVTLWGAMGGSLYGSLYGALWVNLWVAMGPSIGHNEVIGLCRVGGDAAGPGREHWAEMLANPRTPIEQWHPLVEEKALALPKAPAREKASGEKTTEPYWEHWFVLGALGGALGWTG
uniref:Uncharacterized protein n=1 Tax=Gallus gallus TaxID=9031 RepID=A0A8V0X801_CHICK